MGDRDIVARVNGFFVGFLDDDELAAFDRLCADGQARRLYQGAGGFMGLAKVELFPTPTGARP